MFKNRKVYLFIVGVIIFIAGSLVLLYLKGLPSLVSNENAVKYVEDFLKKSIAVDCVIKKPVLKTHLSPDIEFSVENFELKKDNKQIVSVKNFNSEINYKKLLRKTLIIKKLGSDSVFVDVDGVMSLMPPSDTQSEPQKNDFKLDLFNSLLYIKNAVILYSPAPDLNIKADANNLRITETRNPKFVNFDINVAIKKGDEVLNLKINDENKVYFDKKKFIVDGCEFFINKSKIAINYVGTKEQKFNLNLNSDKFYVEDLVDLVSSNLLIPNGDELFALLKDINGLFNFKIKLSDKGIDGDINLNKVNFKIIMLNDIPVVLNRGNIKIDNDKIVLTHLDGYHGKRDVNKLTFGGTIVDYQKSFDTNIEGFVNADNEFVKNYLSETAGIPLQMIGKTVAKVKFKMKNNIIDSSVIFRLKKGYDILVDGASFSPVNYERACRADIVMQGSNLELKNLNYYIAEAFQAGVVAKPLIRVFGNFDMLKNMEIKNLGFEITKPLPSEFLNVLIGQRIFRKGMISGNLEYINAKVPFLTGKLAMDGVRIPSQRLFIKKGELNTDSKNVNIIANGRFKRSGYNFDGHIANEIRLPIVIRDINLKIDDVDVERLLTSFNNQPQQTAETQNGEAVVQNLAVQDNADADNDDGEVTFTTGLLVIEKCALKIVKGVYKKINFGNVIANMTLDKEGVLELHSNKFDIAEGTSAAKVVCDLKNQKYKIRLGIKDVNSEIIAESLLDLPREISGKARGIIALETDKSMKLNGLMKFDIKNGSIAKIGLVQYALNFVSLFRNPLAMISPVTIMDLVNVPEGNFDDISGSLDIKDNVLQKIMIKSSAPHLATFIVGRYDLENSDATLRIYTKFSNKHKGFSGFMRKFSLNALANRVPLSSRNDSNYYSAEISMLPKIEDEDKDCQVFLTKVDGDVEHNNFLSSLKRIK